MSTGGSHGSCHASRVLIAMLNAQVTGLRQCEVCIVCRGGTPPDGSKCPVALRESWLLDLAASFEVPELSDAYDARQPSCA